MKNDLQVQVGNLVGLKLVEIATREENIPFYRGDLRKSILYVLKDNVVEVGTNIIYAKAVHDGLPARFIRPKRAKVLVWWVDPQKRRSVSSIPQRKALIKAKKSGPNTVSKKVRQKARKANPFLIRTLTTFEQEGLDFLKPVIKKYVVAQLLR